jgi:dolichol-phosphate mannosyltransferase
LADLGDSKLDTLVAFEYFQLLLDKLIGHIVPTRFVLFGAIGVLGLFAHLVVLVLVLDLLRFGFPASQAVATIIAMTSNFILITSLPIAANGCEVGDYYMVCFLFMPCTV